MTSVSRSPVDDEVVVVVLVEVLVVVTPVLDVVDVDELVVVGLLLLEDDELLEDVVLVEVAPPEVVRKYAATPATMMIRITATAVTALETARNLLLRESKTYKMQPASFVNHRI